DCDTTTCRDTPTSAPSCSSLESRWNAFSPTQCSAVLMANNSQNIGDYCPIDGSQAICDNGYYCCHECCSTCTSCTVDSDGSRRCTTYSCNCFCCDSTNHQSCQIKCPICYTMELIVQYPLWGGEITTSKISVDYDQALTEVQKFLTENPVESKVRCYYNPENPLQVLLSIDYTVKTWILVGISAFILFLVLVIGTYYIFYNVSFVHGIWIGTIFPLLFFLLLLVPITNKYVLLALSLCFITIGWTPLLINSIIKFKRKSFLIACLITLLFFVLPITIFGLTAILTSVKVMKILLIVLAIIIPIGYIFWIMEVWNRLHIFLTRLFYNTTNEEKNSPIDMAYRNEKPYSGDNAPLTYDEAFAKQ
ncbi:21182_t:CDS:1, partial [Gigaspora rosea]